MLNRDIEDLEGTTSLQGQQNEMAATTKQPDDKCINTAEAFDSCGGRPFPRKDSRRTPKQQGKHTD